MSLTQSEREWVQGQFDDLRRELVQIQIDIATLKVKAGVFGVIGGIIPVLVMIGIYFIGRV